MMLHLIRLSETGIRQFLNLCAHPSLPDAVQALQQVSEAVLSHLFVLLFYLQQVAQKRLKADADGLTGWILHTDRMCISAFIS